MMRSGVVLAATLSGVVASAGCLSVDAISPERAGVERAAIQQDLRHESATLCRIASGRAKAQHPELRARPVVCAVANIETTFKSDVHAIQTISYVCGIAPWQPKRTPPVATPSIALDLLKEGRGVWMINAFP
jgi:hypothetical protein